MNGWEDIFQILEPLFISETSRPKAIDTKLGKWLYEYTVTSPPTKAVTIPVKATREKTANISVKNTVYRKVLTAKSHI